MQSAATCFEQLECRRLFSVIINEFLASNTNGLTDRDGDRSDWIELKNTGASAENIGGWYLTDESANLTKWQFPSTTISAGGTLLVFASEKNRAVAGQQLHTNFKLTSAGEYLALVQADGTTVADSYSPFPEQFDDISYGPAVAASTTTMDTLVGASSTVRVISPTGENAATDDNWREIGFNDSGWLSGTRSVGFDRNTSDGTSFTPYIGRTLSTTEMPSASGSARYTAYVRYSFNLADKEQLTSLQLNMRFDDGFIGYINGKEFESVNFDTDFQRPRPQWDSRSGYQMGSSSLGAVNRGAEAITPVTFDLTPYLPMLVNGTNVLAFHLVNSASTSSSGSGQDLLLEPVLTATRNTASANAQYMVSPTPGTTNGAGVNGIVHDTHFSVDRGFFGSPFQVEITSATAGAQIRYTTDGSAPSATYGTPYTGPITISTTTTLRAIAYQAGFRPSNVDTQTYLFLADVIRQNAAYATQPYATWGHDKTDGDTTSGYNLDDESDWDMDQTIVDSNVSAMVNALQSIPTMSIVMDWDDLFSGTPQPGTPAGSGAVAPSPQGIYIHGSSDERYMSLEYFTAAGAEFHADGAVEMQGHSSTLRWNSDKMSFQVKFKFPYGDTKLDYALFADSTDGANAATSFDTLILDAGYNYNWHHANFVQNNYARFVTDQVTADLQNLASSGGAHGKWVHLYLNGLYWGMYNAHERTDDSYAKKYYDGDKDDYDVIKHANNDLSHEFTWVEGGVAAEQRYIEMLNATRAVESDPTNAVLYQNVENLLDVDQFIDYMTVHYYAGDGADWAHNNWYATRDRNGGKWRFHTWDQEHAFPTTDNGDSWTQFSDLTGKDDFECATEIHVNLMANAEYRLKFADHVQKLMFNGGLLTPTVAASVYQARVDEITSAIIAESARWGDNRVVLPETTGPHEAYTQSDFIATSTAVINDFFPVRTSTVLGHFDSRGWIPTLDAPLFSQYGGDIPGGFQLTLTNPNGSGTIYYTLDGSDPRLVGGAISGSAIAYGGPITLNASAQVKARIFFNASGTANDWSPIEDRTFLSTEPFPVRIVEVHYHPANEPTVVDDEDLEFIELLNTGTQTVSLEGVQITQFSSTPYVFGAGISLAAGQRIVVARDPAVFQSFYGSGINIAPTGYDPQNLSNGGERVALIGPAGETLQDFVYDDIAPWPTAPDGDGPSLEIIDPLGDPSDPTNWRASALDGGSPGTDGIPGDTTAPTIVSASYDFEHGKVVVQFSEDVFDSLEAADAQIEPRAGGSDILPISVTWNGATSTATFSLASRLPNGNYQLRFAAGSVEDAAHNALAAEYLWQDDSFFVLAGDTNRDRRVTISDLGDLASNWQNTAATWSDGDFNFDGSVTISDLGDLASNWQAILDPAAPGSPMALAGPEIVQVEAPTAPVESTPPQTPAAPETPTEPAPPTIAPTPVVVETPPAPVAPVEPVTPPEPVVPPVPVKPQRPVQPTKPASPVVRRPTSLAPTQTETVKQQSHSTLAAAAPKPVVRTEARRERPIDVVDSVAATPLVSEVRRKS